MHAWRGCIEHNGVRLVANGVAGDVEAMLCGQAHVVFDLLRRVAQGAVRRRLDARIRRGAISGAGVEGTVRDELHGTHAAEPVAVWKFPAGMPARVDGGLQSFGVYAGIHTQVIDAGLETLDPRVDVFGHLIIADADHALVCGVLFGLA